MIRDSSPKGVCELEGIRIRGEANVGNGWEEQMSSNRKGAENGEDKETGKNKIKNE